MAQKAIRTELPDGRIVINNIIDEHTGESIQYVKIDQLPSGVASIDDNIFKEVHSSDFGTELFQKVIDSNATLKKSFDDIRQSSDAEVVAFNKLVSYDNEQEIIWEYDPEDTVSVDDGINIIVTDSGKRLKRVSSVNIGDYYINQQTSYIHSPNLLDPSNVAPNRGIFTGGVGANYLTPAPGYISVKHPIPVEYNHYYTKTHQVYNTVFFGYDADDNFVKTLPITATGSDYRTILIDDEAVVGVRFVIASVETAWVRVNTCQFVEGQSLPSSVIPYKGVSKFQLKGGIFTNADYLPDGNEAEEPIIENFIESKIVDKQAYIHGNYRALERDPNSVGYYSFSHGDRAIAIGDGGVAFGKFTSSGRYAFSAGIDNNSEGDGSFTGGMRNSASEGAATTFGKQSNSTGDGAFSAGENARANKKGSTAFGKNTFVIAEKGLAANEDNTTEGYAGATFGKGNINRSARCTVVGTYNDPLLIEPDIADIRDESRPLFVVGNGSDKLNRSNALVVYTNGDVDIVGLVLTAPNGSKYRIGVDNTGTLTTTAL